MFISFRFPSGCFHVAVSIWLFSFVCSPPAISPSATGFGRFRPKNRVFVDFGRKTRILTEINWFWVDCDRKMWFGSILGHFGSLGVSSLGVLKSDFGDLFTWFHRESNPGPPPRELGSMPLHYIPYGCFSEVKPGQTLVLLGWATPWDTTSILRFPAPGGPVNQNTTCKTVAHFLRKTSGADGFPPQKVPIAPGYGVFLFLALNFS